MSSHFPGFSLMRVNINQLLPALRRTLWRHGHFAPEALKHVVQSNGDHVITLVIAAADAEYTPPAFNANPGMGRVSWAKPDPSKP